ncbi:MAG TPA: hypothetical protein VI911_11100 [Patescibacteria group bacterium]|nr:hypothetical protein [Patescibacteria group bacterium]
MSEVTKEMIDGWKAKYGRVAKLSLGGIEWYYRPINLEEYYAVQELANTTEGKSEAVGQEQIIRVAVLSPVVTENIPAGVTLKMSDEILKLSGFVSEEIKPEEL